MLSVRSKDDSGHIAGVAVQAAQLAAALHVPQTHAAIGAAARRPAAARGKRDAQHGAFVTGERCRRCDLLRTSVLTDAQGARAFRKRLLEYLPLHRATLGTQHSENADERWR